MERKTRLYNTKTRRWEWWYIGDPVRMPWEGAWTRARWLARHLHRRGSVTAYALDPLTLDMRDPKGERRTRRRERRDRMLARAANALNTMVEMQKHIG